MINFFVKTQDAERAYAVFKQMVSTSAFSSEIVLPVIKLMIKKEEAQKAYAIFLEILEQAKHIGQHAGLDALTYSSLINLLVRKNEVTLAYEVFHDMKEKGMQSDEKTYIALLNLLVKNEDAKSAYAVFCEMRTKGVRPDTLSYASLIDLAVDKNKEKIADDVYCDLRAKDVQENAKNALAIFREHKAGGSVRDIYTSVIKLLAKQARAQQDFVTKDDAKAIATIFNDLLKNGVPHDDATRSLLIDLLVDAECLQDATKIFSAHESIEHCIKGNKLEVQHHSHGEALVMTTLYINEHWDGSTPFTVITKKDLRAENGKYYQMRDYIRFHLDKQLGSEIDIEISKHHPERLKISENDYDD